MSEEQLKNYSIQNLQMEELVPTSIEGVAISIVNNRREIGLPALMTGEQFTRWKKGKGGPFYRDLFLWTNGKEHGKYVSMEEGDEKLIVRLIDDNEYDDFAIRKLVHGKLVDKHYMILLNLSKNGKSGEVNGYIEENHEDEDILSENSMIVNNQPNIPQDDDEAGSGRSISLFDD